MPQVALDMTSVFDIFGGYREGNFQSRSWPDAFQGMHQKLSREYPFTEWKAIDWDELYDTYYPRVEEAELAQDKFAYYMALREYLFSIPDGYLRISTPAEYREAAIGGDFGFSLLPLDDGRIVVGYIEPDSFAELAGIQWGAEIIEWNDTPVHEALAQVPLVWSDTPPATTEYALFEQCALLARAPVGTEATVLFRNPDSESLWATRLTARRDMFAGLSDLTQQGKPFSEFEAPLETRMLERNVGYIKVYCQASTLVMPFPNRAFRRAIERFVQDDVDGIVLDLRGNTGGLDDIALGFAGHFTREPLFFRDAVVFDLKKGGFALREDASLTVKPTAPYYGGPVAILLHRNTRDGGQNLASTLLRQPNVFSVGVLGTEGSYAYVGSRISMPEGYQIDYPIGRMLDEDGEILITSGVDMTPRLTPEVRVPLTLDALRAFFLEGEDPVLQTAIAEIHNRR